MALQVWLPLTKNLENQGLSDVSVSIQIGTTSFVTGKIGNAFYNTSTGHNILIPWTHANTEELSILLWVKPQTPGAWSDIFTIGKYYNRLENNGYNYYYFFHDNVGLYGNNVDSGGVEIGTLPNETWTHIAFTVSGTELKIYKNGELFDSHSQKYQLSEVMDAKDVIRIGGRRDDEPNYYYQALYNDVRIYDNCLSAKEIKEISKGLCCHYPLNDNFVTSSVNLYDKPYCDGSPSYYTGYTLTKNKDGEGYNFNIEFSGNGNDAWFWIQYPQFSFTDGEMYDYSCKIRINTLNFYLILRAARNSNDWETPSVVTINKTTDGKWIELHTQITIHSSYTFNGTTITANPLLEFCTSPLNSNGFKYVADFDIKDVQVVPISENMSVPFSPKEFRSNVLYDTSGFGNNGYFHDESSGVEFAPNSPRYDGCYKFLSKHYLIGNSPWREDTYLSEFTLSFWLNQEDGSGDYSTFFNSCGYGSDGLWLGMNVEGKGAWAFRNVSPCYATTTPFVCTHNEWYHFVYVFINGTVGWYVNGNAQTWTKYNDTTMHIFDCFILGDNYSGTTWNTTFIGKISDFRWYATALTAEDIKELYNTPITITNNGTLLTQGEIKEEE